MQKEVQELKFVQKRDRIKTVCRTKTEQQPNHRDQRCQKRPVYTPETVQESI